MLFVKRKFVNIHQLYQKAKELIVKIKRKIFWRINKLLTKAEAQDILSAWKVTNVELICCAWLRRVSAVSGSPHSLQY